MEHFDILFFMQLVFFLSLSDCEENTVISISVDEDVPFDCFHSKFWEPQNCSRLKLTKISSNGGNSKVILAEPETPEFPRDGRIKWETNKEKPNVPLLTKVQKSDEGEYSCEIWSGWMRILVKTFTLKIKDCQSHVKTVRLGSIATLDCAVSNHDGVHNHSWFTLKAGVPTPLTDRFHVNGSTLSFKSAQASDSGWYRCKYKLGGIKERCVDINLLVQELPDTTQATQVPTHAQILHGDSGEGFSALHTVAVVAGVVIIAALIGALLYWKHNKRKSPQATSPYTDIVDYNVTYDVVAEDCCTSQSSFQDQDEQISTFGSLY